MKKSSCEERALHSRKKIQISQCEITEASQGCKMGIAVVREQKKRLLHLGITQKERRFRKKMRFLRSKFMLFCFLRLKFCEFLLFKRSFCIAVSSLAVPLYGYRSSADDFCSKSSEPQKALRTKNSYIRFVCLPIALVLYEFLMTQSLFIRSLIRCYYRILLPNYLFSLRSECRSAYL